MGNMQIQNTAALFAQQSAAQQQAGQLTGQTEITAALAIQDSLIPAEPEKERFTLAEMIRDAQEKAEKQKKQFELPKNTMRYGEAPMQAYARLAKARNAAQVSAAAGYARRCIAQFQAEMRRDGENADRIKAAVNQLQKAVSRAGKKKRDLEREKLADMQRVRYERDSELRKAQSAAQENRRRRMMRTIREHGYLRETEIDNRFQEQAAALRTELNTQAAALSEQYAAESTPTPAPAPEIDITG